MTEPTQGMNHFEGITDCAAHVVETDRDCEFCVAELTAKTQVHNDLADEATKRLKTMAGMGAQIDGSAILTERIDTLIDAIIHDPRQRLHFEVSYTARVINRLIDVEREVRMARLTADPSSVTPLRKRR